MANPGQRPDANPSAEDDSRWPLGGGGYQGSRMAHHEDPPLDGRNHHGKASSGRPPEDPGRPHNARRLHLVESRGQPTQGRMGYLRRWDRPVDVRREMSAAATEARCWRGSKVCIPAQSSINDKQAHLVEKCAAHELPNSSPVRRTESGLC